MERSEIVKKLESDNIDEIISAIDFIVNELLCLSSRSFMILRKNSEFRPFIAERFYRIIHENKRQLERGYLENEEDSDLRFWLSSLLAIYDRNDDFILDIYRHVANNEDDKELLGLNILIEKGIANVEMIILEKLRRIVFSIENFDRINFYLEKLRVLRVAVPDDVVEKVNFYNRHIDFEWQRFSY
ncbi:hypothetical protein [Chitinophaga sancti]|uniref:Uncharacterized protein n=1 Tax=Chitinophaga sancti TaxID=1004 RepID=A0A1K1SJ56_9BACT|nr:hypothetical protein [Chitinophaga sancti]WQD64445.1 hypothetical protein U0033_08555 [Chitinophaga sancti]WQG89931.1 hypothetical protein SR876_00365 [Chitinophaga sancti]SFW84298.1 hypothetical protein SAMN05661012_05514 [Chitinophaga sancti]